MDVVRSRTRRWLERDVRAAARTTSVPGGRPLVSHSTALDRGRHRYRRRVGVGDPRLDGEDLPQDLAPLGELLLRGTRKTKLMAFHLDEQRCHFSIERVG